MEGMNVGLKPSEKNVLSAIIENPGDSAVKMAEKIGISTRAGFLRLLPCTVAVYHNS